MKRWEATEESIYDSPCVKQVFQRAKGGSARREDGWLSLCPGGEVCPLRRHQRFTAIGQGQNKNRSIFALHRGPNSEGLPFKGMTNADDSDFFGEVLMMGSVS